MQIFQRFFYTLCLLFCLTTVPLQASVEQLLGNSDNNSQQFLPVEEAFQVNSEVSGNRLIIHFRVTPGHYLYKDRFQLTPANPEVTLGSPTFPAGIEKYDVNFEQTLEVFTEDLSIELPVNSPKTTTDINVRFQGCAEAGLCYPPHTVTLTASGLDVSSEQTTSPSAAIDIEEKGLLTALLLFLLAGIGLTFTPCVLPMIPILSSILVGSASHSRARILSLTLTYVLSMSATFALAGTLMGLFGATLNLQAKLQSPWLLVPFSALFVLLSLSMFGLFELQLPQKLRDRLGNNAQQGGSLPGACLMGMLSALVVSPCVSAPLAGALIYISTTGDALFGGLSLFALGFGMGIPLLLIGFGGRHLLPKAGSWMDKVKVFFGFMLLSIAIWMLERVIPGQITLILWGALAIGVATYLGALDLNKKENGWQITFQALGFLFLIYGICLVVGAAKGNSDPIKPLASLQPAIQGTISQTSSFKTVSTVSELNKELEEARKAGKSVMIDVYADWCLSCKLMEKNVFPDPSITSLTTDMKLIKFDITQNTKEQQVWLTQYELFGPPSLVFFDAAGKELNHLRSLGEISVKELEKRLKSIPASL